MSRSESSTVGTYRVRYDVVSGQQEAAPARRRALRLIYAGVVQWQNISFPS